MSASNLVSTGLSGLDGILGGLRPGDNVVWRVNALDDYRAFVQPFIDSSLAERKRVVYCRFGNHEPLLDEQPGITVYNLDAYRGFESFTVKLHTIIGQEGSGVFYVFDCLSDLLDAWATDTMIGNFFTVTCPYLYELDTVAYFALMRDSHSFRTVARIRATTQLLIDLYNDGSDRYLHPLKVWQRSTPTMFLPHRQKGDEFIPISTSFDATNLFAGLPRTGSESTERHLDYWDILFLKAAELVSTAADDDQRQAMVNELSRILIGREARILALAREHFSISDMLEIKSRLISTGFIGGKAVGMLLARSILRNDHCRDWRQIIEPHDSWYVGSDLFTSYIVHNGWWRLFLEQRSPEGYFTAAARLRENLLQGYFPDDIREEFQKMLEYFGQYPIIVRSSSLLEDGFGNAFAGKYDSFFCVNQGTPEQRYRQFEDAVRRIFASAMSEEALAYRRQRGLDQHDEHMALLVQRVSGALRRHYFLPDLAGVAISYNTFVWNRELDPQAGLLRLVCGLGTRAVDRVEGDYPRLVALDRPLLTPHGNREEQRLATQRDVDLLNLSENALQTVPFRQLLQEKLDIPIELLAERDHETGEKLLKSGRSDEDAWILTCKGLLETTPFTAIMREMLGILEKAYQYPVDVEFTVNVEVDRHMRINLLQCRPLQTKGVQEKRVEIPLHLLAERVLFRTEGNFMGGSIAKILDRVIIVDPEQYDALPLAGKYDIARLVGKLNQLCISREVCHTLLLGPGRWGTSTPGLGVPISFAEISNVTVLIEVAFSAGGLMPDLSFGSHFFQDLVESDIFYVALFPDHPGSLFNPSCLADMPNRLTELMPDAACYKEVVTVRDIPAPHLKLLADILSQQVVCYRPHKKRSPV
ncbi:MAG: PEP/pyruvate-binding domain-containing protein [Geobacteraceae bacterium]